MTKFVKVRALGVEIEVEEGGLAKLLGAVKLPKAEAAAKKVAKSAKKTAKKSAKAPAKKGGRKPASAGPSLPDRILASLVGNPSPSSPAEIAKAIGAPLGVVATTCARLSKIGKMMKLGRGQYVAKASAYDVTATNGAAQVDVFAGA